LAFEFCLAPLFQGLLTCVTTGWHPALQQIVDLDSAILGSFPSESPLRRQPTPQLNHFQPQQAKARPTYFPTPSLPLSLSPSPSRTPPPAAAHRARARERPRGSPHRPRGQQPLVRAKMLGFSTGQLLVILGACSVMMSE